jgi:hypothetical protein
MWVYGLIASVQGIAMANVMPPATTTVMAALPRERAGVGSSVNNTVRQVGGALGVAVLGTVLTSAYRGRVQPLLQGLGLNSDTAHSVSGSIQATQTFVGQSAAAHPKAATLIAPANDAFVHAMHITTLVAAGIMVVAAAIVLSWMPRKSELPTGGVPTGAPKSAESVAA